MYSWMQWYADFIRESKLNTYADSIREQAEYH